MRLVGSEVLERLGKAENAALRAKGLTQQLLTFSKGGAPVRKPQASLRTRQVRAPSRTPQRRTRPAETHRRVTPKRGLRAGRSRRRPSRPDRVKTIRRNDACDVGSCGVTVSTS